MRNLNMIVFKLSISQNERSFIYIINSNVCIKNQTFAQSLKTDPAFRQIKTK